MECELMQIVELGPDTGLVLGRVLAMHVTEDAVVDPARGSIDTPRLNLIGRMHGGWYTRTSDLFSLERISVADWEVRKRGSGVGEENVADVSNRVAEMSNKKVSDHEGQP